MKKILIVEDELIIAKDIELKLRSMGYKVIGIAESYDNILKIFEKEMPDLILMDIFIKGDINGVEAAKLIYKKYDIPIVYLTADSEDETIQKTKMENTYGYLIKPIKNEDLKTTLEFALYKYETNKKILKLEQEKRSKERVIMRQKRFISLGDLAALLAHEIRQPLNTMKILSDTIIYSLEGTNLSDKCKEHIDILKKISQNVDYINQIIVNINNIIKKNNNVRPELNNEEININQIIERFINLNIEKIKNNNIHIKFNADKNIKTINFIPIHFEEILENFLSNSIKAFNKTDKKDKKIIIETLQEENSIVLNFIDNATGIPEDVIENIFDPFFTTDKDKKESTGLGLYIVHNILTSYDGIIDCFNNELGGITFKIILKPKT